MNCSLGQLKNISIAYEKYNITETNPGSLSFSSFEQFYANLTSQPVVKKLDLKQREDDNVDDAINATYWRIYVPIGVAGSCSGNIVFGATKSPE